MSHSCAMGHKHEWFNEPPMEPKIYCNKSFDERYGDEEDEAFNSFLTSPEELQRLRLLLEKNPDFEASSSWPQLVEWCSSCTQTRRVRLVLPEVEKEVPELEAEEEKTTEESYEPVADEVDHEQVVEVEKTSQQHHDAMVESCEPAAGVKSRRRSRGGQGSRRRRLLAFQMMLTEKRGLPLSRLLSSEKTEAMSSREEMMRMQEESASPVLRRRSIEEKEEIHKYNVEKEEGEGRCSSLEASTGGSTIFTPRSTHASVILPSPNFFPQVPGIPPFPNLVSPFSTPSFHSPQLCSLMPGPQWVVCGGCHTWGTIIPC